MVANEPHCSAGHYTGDTVTSSDRDLAPKETRVATALSSSSIGDHVLETEVSRSVDKTLPVDDGSSAVCSSEKPWEGSSAVAEVVGTAGEVADTVESVGQDIRLRWI